MCVSTPMKLVQLCGGNLALADIGGVRKEISIALTPEAQVGDYVTVHVGHAIARIDPEAAAETLRLMAGVGDREEQVLLPLGSGLSRHEAVLHSCF